MLSERSMIPFYQYSHKRQIHRDGNLNNGGESLKLKLVLLEYRFSLGHKENILGKVSDVCCTEI